MIIPDEDELRYLSHCNGMRLRMIMMIIYLPATEHCDPSRDGVVSWVVAEGGGLSGGRV